MKKSWAIMRHDLLKISRNPLTIVTSVLLPIIYLVIFGNSFQGVLKNLPVVIVGEDSGPYGLRMMEKMQALATLREGFVTAREPKLNLIVLRPSIASINQ